MPATSSDLQERIYEKFIQVLDPIPDVSGKKADIDGNSDMSSSEKNQKKEELDQMVVNIKTQYEKMSQAIAEAVLEIFKEKGLDLGDSKSTKMEVG